MKPSYLLAFALFIFTSLASARPSVHQLDPEMTGPEYRALLKGQKKSNYFKSFEDQQPKQSLDPESLAEDSELEVYIKLGERNLDWVDLINSVRSPEDKLSLSSEATTNAYPLSAPRLVNFAIVKEAWDILKALMPEPLKKVLFEGAPLTATLPLSEREFYEWMFQVDRAYQLAARYKMLKPYKNYYVQYAAYDVRGYITLSQEKKLESKLEHWSALSDAEKSRISKALLRICRNNEVPTSDCGKELQVAVNKMRLLNFYTKYIAKAKANHDSFFQIPQWRNDVTWTAVNPNVLSIPFANPGNPVVLEFLEYNIEDEFRFGDWRLDLEFVDTKSDNTTHIVFEAGTTPHVNELGGSVITMDANAPLTEYDVQWTIRHEYGHVLGLPDCYFEFYEEEEEAFMSYQLDVTNLMCSRRGRFQEKHYQELKRVYFKN